MARFGSDRPLDDHLATVSAGQAEAVRIVTSGVEPMAEAGSMSRSSDSRVVESLQWIHDTLSTRLPYAPLRGERERRIVLAMGSTATTEQPVSYDWSLRQH